MNERNSCAEKRAKKKKSIFSLQELLCKDVEALDAKPKGKRQKKSKSRDKTEGEEFETFIK